MTDYGRVLRTRLLGIARAVLRRLGPAGEYPSRTELTPAERDAFQEALRRSTEFVGYIE